jgi:arylsulfatase A-like enzyme
LPAIISWPNHLPKNETRSQMAHACDWLPTLAELCDVKILNPDIDGKSLVGVLKSNSPSPHKTIYWQVGEGKGAQWAVRDGDWKLIANIRDISSPEKAKQFIPLFLANIAGDPGEQKNLADANPEIVERLRKLHDAVK